MNIFRRSVLYVFRNVSRTILLFIIVFVVSAFVLCGLAVMNASNDTSEELRGTTGASFTVERNLETGGSNNQGNGMSYNTQEYVTDDMISDISKVDGILAYNAKYRANLEMHDTEDKAFEMIKTSTKWDSVGLNYTSTTLGSFFSEYDSMFLSGELELTEGRHLIDTDENAIMISNDLADKCGLKLGDKVKLFSSDSTQGLSTDGGDAQGTEIIGLFDVIAEQPDKDSTVSYDLFENYIFADMKTVKNLTSWVDFDKEREGYEYADFYVSDPQQLELIIREVQKIDNIDWNNFNVTVNDEVYERSANSMSNVITLIRTMIILIIIISTVIVTLILCLWLKTRIHETGVFMAIGIGKASLIFQHYIELFIISVPALVLSWITSKKIAVNAAKVFDSSIKSSTVIVTNKHIIIVFAVTLVILCISILISCIPVLRMKPKEVLSKME